MDWKSDLLAFALVSFAVLGVTHASTPASLLKGYNVSGSLASNAVFSNITYSGTRYTMVNVSNTPYFLINDSGSGSFVLDSNSIAAIIGPGLTASWASRVNFGALHTTMNQYIGSSAASINDCVQETGIDRATCTVTNYCQSCALVPACNRVLYQTSGPTGPVGSGIMLFEQQYAQLQSNVSMFNEYANASSTANVFVRAQEINRAVANLTKITKAIGENPLFPPPVNADYSVCGTSGSITMNLSSGGSGWYCNSIGYCQSTTYNATLLSKAAALLSIINAQLPGPSTVLAMAKNISANEDKYITPVLVSRQGAALTAALTSTLAGFNSLINDGSALLTHISDPALGSEISAAQANYSHLKSDYTKLNVTQYAQGILSQLNAIRQQYARLNASYSAALGTAKNNTAVLIALQLAGDRSNQTTALAFEEQLVNQQLLSQVSNLSAIGAKLGYIQSRIPAPGSSGLDMSPEALVRAIDGPFASAMSGALGMSYPAAVGAVPAFSALLSLIIGLILFSILYLQYFRLKQRHKIRVTHKTSSAWRALFIIAAVLVIIYAAATYAVASAANSSAPESAFSGALSASHGVVIAVNGTVTTSLSNCAAQISAYASQRGFASNTIYLSGNACTGTGELPQSASDCLNHYARLDVPVIMLTQTNSSEAHAGIYSMYGTMLSFSGNASFMNSCYAGFFVR